MDVIWREVKEKLDIVPKRTKIFFYLFLLKLISIKFFNFE